MDALPEVLTHDSPAPKASLGSPPHRAPQRTSFPAQGDLPADRLDTKLLVSSCSTKLERA